MADEMHKLQKDPPEGSREVIEHELKRQEQAGESDKPSGGGKGQPAGQANDNGKQTR
jgi:hypothetical protein